MYMTSALATDKKRISVYIPEDLLEDFRKLAKARKRPVSNMIEWMVTDAVAKAKASGEIQ